MCRQHFRLSSPFSTCVQYGAVLYKNYLLAVRMTSTLQTMVTPGHKGMFTHSQQGQCIMNRCKDRLRNPNKIKRYSFLVVNIVFIVSPASSNNHITQTIPPPDPSPPSIAHVEDYPYEPPPDFIPPPPPGNTQV